MKLSLAWIFDHIDADWRTINITTLVELFNHKVAEIETYEKIEIDSKSLFFVQVTENNESSTEVWCPDHHKNISLTFRNNVFIGEWLLATKHNDIYAWATLVDLGGQKEGLLGAIHVANNDHKAVFDTLELSDYVIHVDNKSVTHRPDLWGHRGFAQEIALLLNLTLKPLDNFLYTIEQISYDKCSEKTDYTPFTFDIQTTHCKRFAALSVTNVEWRASSLWMIGRLSKIDSRPIDLLVDLSNYVMFDTGQPMHVFDADTLLDSSIIIRNGHQNEQLTTLDSQTIELTENDIVIANGTQLLSLAGIMGGTSSSVTKTTKNLLVESACFEATPIRLSAMRHKKRTEASARFEKGLGSNQNTIAIERYVNLLHKQKVSCVVSSALISVGMLARPKNISLSHDVLERSLGVTIDTQFVQETLKKLHCQVDYCPQDNLYSIVVPTTRSAKDLTLQEDIIEEIARFYGYHNIPVVLPQLIAVPDKHFYQTKRLRIIKQFFSTTMRMHEINSYAFFDETFLSQLEWQPENSVTVHNPVSANWSRMITTLIPNMCKALYDNMWQESKLRFFECGRVWHIDKDTDIKEHKRVTGIIFDQNSNDTFYHMQDYLIELFTLIGIQVTWHKQNEPQEKWFTPYQTASIQHNNTVIGKMGVVPLLFLKNVAKGGMTFAFDIDLDYLLTLSLETPQFVSPSKFPYVSRDISIVAPWHTTAYDIKQTIFQADKRITQVELIDSIEKETLVDGRALTIRCVMADNTKTFTKEEVDAIQAHIIHVLSHDGVTLQ